MCAHSRFIRLKKNMADIIQYTILYNNFPIELRKKKRIFSTNLVKKMNIHSYVILKGERTHNLQKIHLCVCRLLFSVTIYFPIVTIKKRKLSHPYPFFLLSRILREKNSIHEKKIQNLQFSKVLYTHCTYVYLVHMHVSKKWNSCCGMDF